MKIKKSKMDEKIEVDMEKENLERYKERKIRVGKRERERWGIGREQEELEMVVQGCRKRVRC